MNRQQVFDDAVKHLLQMPRQAANDSGGCSYLLPDGNRCVVGAMIPDGHPGLKFTGSAWPLVEEHPDLAQLWGVQDQKDKGFLEQLQHVHDNWGHWSQDGPFNQWGCRALRGFAATFKLNASVVPS